MSDAGNGSVHNSYSYTDFGQVITATTSTTSANSHTFAGEQADPTGLSYNRARYYNPTTGRFIQQDSFGGAASDPLSQNRYVYAANSPTKYTDPSGHCFWVCAAVGAVVGAVIGAGGDIIHQVTRSDHRQAFSWGEVGQSAAIGAAVGLVGGLTFGLGMLAGGAVAGGFGIEGAIAGAAIVGGSGVVSGQVAHAAANVLSGKPVSDGLFNPGEMAFDALTADVLHKVFGGNFSDFAPGAGGTGGINASGPEQGVAGLLPDGYTPKALLPDLSEGVTTQIGVYDLRFTQSGYRGRGFRTDLLTGNRTTYTVQENIELLKNDLNFNLPPIRVFRKEEYMNTDPRFPEVETPEFGIAHPRNLESGRLYTLDNRRLVQYRAAGRKWIPAILVDEQEVISNIYEFSTIDQGRSIRLLPPRSQ